MIRRTALSVLLLGGFSALFLGSTGDAGDEIVSPPPPAPDEVAAHCDAIAELSTCVEYATRDEAEADCVSFDGTVGDGPCTSDGLAGSCAVDGKTRKYYTTGGSPNDATYAERHCTNAMAGQFSAP